MKILYEKRRFSKSHPGTGSTENKGESRDKQKKRIKQPDLCFDARPKIARQAGLGRDRIADIDDLLAGTSGRDHYAGGNDNGMGNQNTNSGTGG